MEQFIREIEFDAVAFYSSAGCDLRLHYQLFEEIQRSRIAHGERLRAIVQGRSLYELVRGNSDADHLLKAIAAGETVGAPRMLEQAYSRAVADEVYARVALRESMEAHPAWPWLTNIKGIGHLLAARLLSRLDVGRADTPSAFWAYCGLSTIPGVAYRCSRCRLEVAYPVGYKAPRAHRTVHGRGDCSGEFEQIAENRTTRVSPRASMLGGRARYDAQARVCCYLVGVSILRCGGEYRRFYDDERERLTVSRPGWTAQHHHLAALRKMEKTFLRDLWLAWRSAVNLPVVPPYFPRNLPRANVEPC